VSQVHHQELHCDDRFAGLRQLGHNEPQAVAPFGFTELAFNRDSLAGIPAGLSFLSGRYNLRRPAQSRAADANTAVCTIPDILPVAVK